MSRILGGCTSVSIVRATAGLARSAGSFCEFFAVDITIVEPFHANAMGMARVVPSVPTYASRVTSRASSSWLYGLFRTSRTSLRSMVGSSARDRVAHEGHTVLETGGFDEPEVLTVLEHAGPLASRRRADHQPELVDDTGCQQRAHERQAPPQPEILAALLLELPDRGSGVACHGRSGKLAPRRRIERRRRHDLR